jgi:opacity protein-like surface antigen
MKLSALLALFLVLILPVTAFAAPRATGYGSIFIGANMAVDDSIDTYDPYYDRTFTDDIEYDPGIYVGGAVGGDMGIVRIEGEISYRQSQIDQITLEGASSSSHVDGDVGVLAIMANVFFDIPTGGPVTPYIGGGIGFASIAIDDTRVDGYYYSDSDDEGVFAYQLGAGVAIDLNRRLALDIGYRFFGTSEADFAYTSMEYQSHSVMLGLRYGF